MQLYTEYSSLKMIDVLVVKAIKSCNSYTMATRDLPDIYALARGPQARGRGHIYQANPEWPWYK